MPCMYYQTSSIVGYNFNIGTACAIKQVPVSNGIIIISWMCNQLSKYGTEWYNHNILFV
jgi:hypothetical protein